MTDAAGWSPSVESAVETGREAAAAQGGRPFDAFSQTAYVETLAWLDGGRRSL